MTKPDEWLLDQIAELKDENRQKADSGIIAAHEHTRIDENGRGGWCRDCMEDWPCRTIAALASAYLAAAGYQEIWKGIPQPPPWPDAVPMTISGAASVITGSTSTPYTYSSGGFIPTATGTYTSTPSYSYTHTVGGGGGGGGAYYPSPPPASYGKADWSKGCEVALMDSSGKTIHLQALMPGEVLDLSSFVFSGVPLSIIQKVAGAPGWAVVGQIDSSGVIAWF